MKKFPENYIESIKKSVSIVDVIGSVIPLKRTGRVYIGRCIFHQDRHPSLCVYPETQSWYCFGCGAGSKNNGISGDAIGFVMAYERLSFKEAVEYLRKFTGTPLIVSSFEPVGISRPRCNELSAVTFEIYNHSAQFYHSLLFSKAGVRALNFLTKVKGYP